MIPLLTAAKSLTLASMRGQKVCYCIKLEHAEDDHWHAVDFATMSGQKSGSAVPSVKEFVKQIQKKIVKNESLFYAGTGDFDRDALAYAQKYHLRTIFDFVDRAQTAGLTSAQVTEFWNNASAAYAQVSCGNVYVLLPGDTSAGTTWHKGTVWDSIEWPELRKSGKADVYRVNQNTRPENGRKILSRKLIGKCIVM